MLYFFVPCFCVKGKITKSVEEKITDFKARNQEEGSPHHKPKTDLKMIKDSKENSSVSDSEELSESSISKTCGIVSTTEGKTTKNIRYTSFYLTIKFSIRR